MSEPEYVLGAEAREILRLRQQQAIWGKTTERLLDTVGPRAGARCIDVGCGPGFVLPALRARAGDDGRIVALDESPRMIAYVARTARESGWTNVSPVQGRVEEVALAPASFDFVFSRWVFSHLRAPEAVLARLAQALAPGGVIALIDYNLEGWSLFPESLGFRALQRATRMLYEAEGGDLYVGGRLPAMFHEAGLELLHLEAVVMCGTPGSPAFQWGESFLMTHAAGMVTAGVLDDDDQRLFVSEWEDRRRSAGSTYFSPIVVHTAARKRP